MAALLKASPALRALEIAGTLPSQLLLSRTYLVQHLNMQDSLSLSGVLAAPAIRVKARVCRPTTKQCLVCVCAAPAAGLEGLTDVGLSHMSSLQHLTRLCVEAEETTGISLASLSAVRRLHRLRKLHWCSKDSLHGPLDTDLLTAQLSGLTGLRQLVLLVSPDSEAYTMSGWRIVLQRRLPLCRLVLRRELLLLDAWGDVPDEDGL